MWDVAYDGYCGGKNTSLMKWNSQGVSDFIAASSDVTTNYGGDSIVCFPVKSKNSMKSPMPLYDPSLETNQLGTSDLILQDVRSLVAKQIPEKEVKDAIQYVYKTLEMHQDYQMIKDASQAAGVGETTQCRLLYKGTSTFIYTHNRNKITYGCGHHGHDYVGVASVRNGKSLMAVTAPSINMVQAPPIAVKPIAANP